MKPTPGDWIARGRTVFPAGETALSIGVAEQHRKEAADNAALWAEAGSVFNATGKSPRQLADDLAAALDALKRIDHFALVINSDVRFVKSPHAAAITEALLVVQSIVQGRAQPAVKCKDEGGAVGAMGECLICHADAGEACHWKRRHG